MYRALCIKRGDKGLRRVNPGLGQFDQGYVLCGLLIDADFDRSLAARIMGGFERRLAIRILAVIVCFMVIATTVVAYDGIHHCAGQYRLCLQWPDGHYEQEQGSQEWWIPVLHRVTIISPGVLRQPYQYVFVRGRFVARVRCPGNFCSGKVLQASNTQSAPPTGHASRFRVQQQQNRLKWSGRDLGQRKVHALRAPDEMQPRYVFVVV